MPDASAQDLVDFLRAYDRPPPSEVAPLAGGEENENLVLSVGDERLVLRRYRWRDPSDVDWELRVVGHLAARGFPTPAAEGGRWAWLGGRPAALFPYVAGQHPPTGSIAAAETIVRALAEQHRLTAGLDLPSARAGGDLWRMARFRREVVEEGAHAGHPELDGLMARIDAFGALFGERAGRRWPELPSAVVHHDAHAGNILLAPDKSLAALLDFDMAHVAPRIVELASLIHSWAAERYPAATIDWARARHLVATYNACARLTASEWDVLPYVVALYYLADAVDYVRSRLARDPQVLAVSNCSMHARFLHLTGDASWPDAVRDHLARS